MIVSWNTTKKCNLFCEHCYRESGPDVESIHELSTSEGKQLLNELKLAGFKIVILSGGEPLMRNDIFELSAYAREIGLRPVLGTNGTLLSRGIAGRLVESGVLGVAISLDSTSSQYHDKFRNRKGAWDKAVKGIKNALDVGLRVQINTTVTDNNFDQFNSVVDFAADLGVQAVHPFFLVPTGRGKSIEEESLKREKYFRMIKTVLNKQKEVSMELKPTCAPQFIPMAREMEIPIRFTRGCLAGVSYCCILPDGDIHICPYLPIKVGNVKEKPFNEIWKESDIFIKLRSFKEYEGRCGGCSSVNVCGGCRARAYYYSDGNYMAEEPWCYKFGE